jgi:hypothetical protein
VQAKSRDGALDGTVEVPSNRERSTQLVSVLLVSELRVLVEPFRCEQFGRLSDPFASVLKVDSRLDEDLLRFSQRDSPKAERQP